VKSHCLGLEPLPFELDEELLRRYWFCVIFQLLMVCSCLKITNNYANFLINLRFSTVYLLRVDIDED